MKTGVFAMILLMFCFAVSSFAQNCGLVEGEAANPASYTF
jgi:hypothetical protein